MSDETGSHSQGEQRCASQTSLRSLRKFDCVRAVPRVGTSPAQAPAPLPTLRFYLSGTRCSYKDDPTQCPACAIAAGAATIYRNYFAPVAGSLGQRKERQLDGLADPGASLSADLNRPVETLWRMQNGYALCGRDGLDAIVRHLGALMPEQLDALHGKLRIGIHRDVEVTDCATEPRPLVSQAFCSALPVSYTTVPAIHWKPFASLVLEGAYEATMWAAARNARRGASNVVLLTSLGGGAFGNDESWIHGAIRRALQMMSGFDLDVRLVSYGAPARALLQLARDFDRD